MLPLALLGALAYAAPPSEDVVMYHVNPARFGPIPTNMDAADEAGDLFFEMMEVLTVPLACADPSRDPRSHFECDNPESASPTDVVNKVTLTVTGGYSGYAMCNIGRNGTDGLGHACADGTYCCFCAEWEEGGHHWPPQEAPCNATVGRVDVLEHRHGGGGFCLKDYECFSERAAEKFKGARQSYWYSLLEYGACALHSSPAANCTWSLKSVDKIVAKACHAASLFGSVSRARPEPFASCGGPVNASDACWVRGFYEAVLGPTAGKPFGKVEGGLPLEDVLGFWSLPFASDDPAQGGCPGLPIPSITEVVEYPQAQQSGGIRSRMGRTL
jgi:hypothetical protein